MIANWLSSMGLAGMKPVLAALALPPVPFLVLALAGAWWARTRPRLGRGLVAFACVSIWLASCNRGAEWAERRFLAEPPALTATDRAALKARAAAGESIAIVVLGGGVDLQSPEFGRAALKMIALARLHYGVFLSRETCIPLAASGGRGWAAADDPAPSEAEVMATAARLEFEWPLRWTETASRDTHENAANTVPLLAAAGVREIVVVTNGWHMPRAMKEFRAAASATATGVPGAAPLRIVAAPMGLAGSGDSALLGWMPSGEGAQRMRVVLRELLASFAEPVFQPLVASPRAASAAG